MQCRRRPAVLPSVLQCDRWRVGGRRSCRARSLPGALLCSDATCSASVRCTAWGWPRVGRVLAGCWPRGGCVVAAWWLRGGCVVAACWLRVGCVLAACWLRGGRGDRLVLW